MDPEPLENHKYESQNFLRHAHGVLLDVFTHLDKHLGLAPGTLGGLCPLDKPSASCVRLLSKRPGSDSAETSSITLAGHTDIGLMTMLFNVVSGLQVLPPGSENIPSNWRYVKPQPGCVMFQVADTLVQLTGGALRSVIHRVVSAPGEQGLVTRRSLAYFVRVENNASMRRLRGDGIPTLAEGEEDEERSPLAWADTRVNLVIKGKLEPWTADSAKEALKSADDK
jgi:isopenicillin N synthase-like dioxygenase